MNGIFGQLDQSFKAVWVSNSGAVGRGISMESLAPEQIAVFPADQYSSNEEYLSLVTPNFKTNKRLVLKQGIAPFKGQSNVFLSRQDKKARSSFEFEAADIISWKGVKGSKGAKAEIVAIGYDGIDASKSLNKILKDAKPLYVNIRLSGEPIKRFFHKNFVDHRFVIDKELCLGGCDIFDACGLVPADLIADAIIKQVSEQDLFVPGKNGVNFRAPIRQFIKASKIKKCENPITPLTLTESKKFTISIPDDGQSVLGKLAAAYPTLKIVKESRADSVTVYAAWLPVAAGSPASFTLASHVQPICDTCPTCPQTYTTVAGLKVVQVRVAAGVVPTLIGSVDSDLLSSTQSGGDVYLIKVPSSQTDAEILAQLTSTFDAGIIGIEGKKCVGADVTFAWTTCESRFATTSQYQITLPDSDCSQGVSRLTELQAAYPSLVIAERSAGSCMHSYETTVTSNYLPLEECDREMAAFTFKAPAGYEGYLWEKYTAPVTEPDCTVPIVAAPPCCVVGVTFETAFWDQSTDECTFGWTSWHPTNKKPVRMQANIHSSDYSGNPCDEFPSYSTILQKLSMDLGTYGELVQEYERSNTLAYENKYWVSNPYVNEVTGFQVTAKANVLYDQYTLKLKRKQYGDSHMLLNQGVTDYVFYVPTGEGAEIEDFINELVLSAGNPDLKAVKL